MQSILVKFMHGILAKFSLLTFHLEIGGVYIPVIFDNEYNLEKNT